MTIDVYPAKLEVREDGKYWQNVLPMEGNDTRLREELRKDYTAEVEGDPFEPNPEYFPFSSMNISSGNFYAILRAMRISDVDDCMDNGRIEINEVFKKAHAALFSHGRVRDMEEYTCYRIFSLFEMARLGITRGATHIVWS